MSLSKKQNRDNLGKFIKTHNASHTREYYTWANMIHRCNCKSAHNYSDYGGRGISVCDRWIESFENFLSDVGERPYGTSIERIDVNGNYEPSNCRWATAKEQANNRRNTIKINGYTIVELSEITGITISAIKNRVKRGWDEDRIMNQPLANNYGQRK